jgi:hypothetical protein
MDHVGKRGDIFFWLQFCILVIPTDRILMLGHKVGEFARNNQVPIRTMKRRPGVKRYLGTGRKTSMTIHRIYRFLPARKGPDRLSDFK